MRSTEFDILPEDVLRNLVDVMVRLVEAAGALIIMLGAVLALIQCVRVLVQRETAQFTAVRLTLGRFLALGLEFQLAGDILRSAIAPTFEELGKLAVVAAIRTALNYFLAREIKEETRDTARPSMHQDSHRVRGGADAPPTKS